MTAHFWGRPDSRTGDGCGDIGVIWARKYHRVGRVYHDSNGECYLEKNEFYTFMIKYGRKAGGITLMMPGRGWVIMTAMVMLPRK